MTSAPTQPAILRTPDHRFDKLAGFNFQPQYTEVSHHSYGKLRMHYLDEGAAQAEDSDQVTVLMLHGEPTWCYLYRKVIPAIVAAGHRAIAPDHIGFGRSDKMPLRSDYSYQQFVDWLIEFVEQLDLRNIILLCQDWGGPIGLRTLAALPDRFSAVVVANTLLPNCEQPPTGVPGWPGEIITNWVAATKEAPDLPVSEIVNGVCVNPLSDTIKMAYDAPFPDASYKAAVLEFPSLIPTSETMAGTAENRAAWEVLRQWDKPFVTAFSDGDPSAKAWEEVFQQQVAGARQQPHTEISNAGHFLQEEQGESLAKVVVELIGRL